MGSGGSAVDAMVIGCLGVERRAERFLSYLAIFSHQGPMPTGFVPVRKRTPPFLTGSADSGWYK
jgi:hypothetical protein